ncbi:MAG: NAD(P)/FAD-dependent oxidoreductase [Rhodospirillales bacterium]|nr:NAD(P)/FAD-dependent oxidoreductase [Rhodospirillales bacterium]MCW8863126.1 NAD(P)/FAD-dependent oxidoreductase [Rhodospirillales bacterium]MCW8951334.1 NAD(P)/FAD-dependent oxidoreductase [Rhodospirillales bacterium]MCW8970528.1 NAD(P)/FAD-dependent oxidoreductase [Rhodospirillales bacterium]MCW9001914.1 NAD(P)/FAD-dependent oxidoreductase [Rhodospirillales bacterium]
MFTTSRRDFLRITGAAGALSALSLSGCQSKARVVVIGGGFGGATAAKYVKWFDPSIDVTLIDASKTYTTCPFSNLVLGGIRSLASITHNFDAQAGRGVNVVNDMVTGVDTAKQIVMTKGGAKIPYDRLIMSPGIDFKYDTIEGYDATVAEAIPHAWKAGTQTAILRQQLEAMPDGGTVIIAPPPNPFRCPPGPYERASMIAYYLKMAKPKSKLLILDSKDKFSKQGLFQEGWALHYKDIIEWVPASKDGKVRRVDAASKTFHTEFTAHKGDVLNYIPAQKAADIAFKAGLTNQLGWCPVHFQTFESTLVKNVHVIGDASIATKMPKSGNAANTQAKVCAAAVADLLNGREPGTPTTTNTCYSLITKDYGISVTAVYKQSDKGYMPVAGAGGLSPKGEGPEFRQLEAKYARGWYANIAQDIWG